LPGGKISDKGTLPNLIIIGAMKCATTSLHYYLNLHPQISMSQIKELNFFVPGPNWSKGLEWYKSNFTGQAAIHGEATTNYTNYPRYQGIPERIHSIVPEAKLIYMVRDPIDRISSNYIQDYVEGRETRSFVKALTPIDDSNPYVAQCKYFMQLEQYLAFFARSNILVITVDDLRTDRIKTLSRIFRFLGVDDSFYSPRFFLKWNETRYKRKKSGLGFHLAQLPVTKIIGLLPFETRGAVEKLIYYPFSRKIKKPIMPENLRQALIEFLKEDIDRLRDFTGYELENWRV